jgi:hypothetical protein
VLITGVSKHINICLLTPVMSATITENLKIKKNMCYQVTPRVTNLPRFTVLLINICCYKINVFCNELAMHFLYHSVFFAGFRVVTDQLQTAHRI